MAPSVTRSCVRCQLVAGRPACRREPPGRAPSSARYLLRGRIKSARRPPCAPPVLPGAGVKMTSVVGITGMPSSASLHGPPPAVPPGLLTACRDLAARYRGVFSPETVLRTVYESYQLFIATSARAVDVPGDSGSDIHGNGDSGVVVGHATRFAADWLADAARVSAVGRTPRVLFACLHDTGRAQMAEALLRRRAGGRVVARSAGPVAGRAIQPAVVTAMAELGIGISAEYPEPLLDDIVRAADVVVTMGCGDICPVYLGKHYLDWPLRGATGSGIAAIRSVRDQIDVYVGRLLRDMTRRPPLRNEPGLVGYSGGLRGLYN